MRIGSRQIRKADGYLHAEVVRVFEDHHRRVYLRLHQAVGLVASQGAPDLLDGRLRRQTPPRSSVARYLTEDGQRIDVEAVRKIDGPDLGVALKRSDALDR